MSTEPRQCGALIAVILAAMLCGCASEPRSIYPVFEQTLESDAALDCSGLDDEILKANAIRDAIFEEHGDVMDEAILSSAVNIATDPIFGAMHSIFIAGSASKAAKEYIEAASAAGVRMEQLLIYKERDDCLTGPTANPELTDTLVLNELRNLQSQFENEEVSEKSYILARRELLDSLR